MGAVIYDCCPHCLESCDPENEHNFPCPDCQPDEEIKEVTND